MTYNVFSGTLNLTLSLSTRVHVQSRDKDGGHTIRSAVYPKTRLLHANFTTLFDRTGVIADLPIEVLHCGNRDFRPFWPCNLNLDPMTFIYELDP